MLYLYAKVSYNEEFLMAMTTKQASEKWGISDRRVRVLCLQGKIDSAYGIIKQRE